MKPANASICKDYVISNGRKTMSRKDILTGEYSCLSRAWIAQLIGLHN